MGTLGYLNHHYAYTFIGVLAKSLQMYRSRGWDIHVISVRSSSLDRASTTDTMDANAVAGAPQPQGRPSITSMLLMCMLLWFMTRPDGEASLAAQNEAR